MSDDSKIEWTDATWNPVRGCVKVSPGCKHCYAETFAERWRGVKGNAYEHGFDPRLVPEKLDVPLRWQRPRRIFVNSMSDLFGGFVPDEYVGAVFGVMASARHHTFQVLTKRAVRMRQWFEWIAKNPLGPSRACGDCLTSVALQSDSPEYQAGYSLWSAVNAWPLANVHLGVSVEDRKYGLPRIEELRETPAALRFLSVEPLLEDLGELDLTGIGWVIVGGESGPGARPMRPEWVRSIRDQCVAAHVPFFFKQWGGVLKKKTGRDLDGRTWDEFPQGVVRGA